MFDALARGAAVAAIFDALGGHASALGDHASALGGHASALDTALLVEARERLRLLLARPRDRSKPQVGSEEGRGEGGIPSESSENRLVAVNINIFLEQPVAW